MESLPLNKQIKPVAWIKINISKPVAPSELSTFPALPSYVLVMFDNNKSGTNQTSYLRGFCASWLVCWTLKLKNSRTFPDFWKKNHFVHNDVC